MHIAIVGAGTMGARVARDVALHAEQVTLHDSDDSSMRLAVARISRALEQDLARGFTVTESGVTVVPKGAVIED